MALGNRRVKHVDAEERRQFEAMSPTEQAWEIFLNGRETNGYVADAIRDIAALSQRVERLEAGESEVQLTTRENLAVSQFTKTWGKRATGAILLGLALLGGLVTALQILEMVR